MLPPHPVLQGPKGGRYVETAAGRHYVDEDYGKRPERLRAAPDEHAEAQRAVDKILAVKPPSFPIQERLGENKVSTVYTVILDGEVYDEQRMSHGMLPKYALMQSAERITKAIFWENEANAPTATPAEKKIALEKRDAMHAMAEKVYGAYLEERDRFNKENQLTPEDLDYEPERPNPAAALGLVQHMHKVGLGEIHGNQSYDWVKSSSSPNAIRLHGALRSLGVPGSLPEEHAETHKLQQGESDLELKRYVREIYNLTQAALEKDGVQELKLYRGAVLEKAARVSRHEGVEVKCKVRPASSWTTRYETAKSFANAKGGISGAVMEAKVPASQIYAYHKLFGNGSGEDEYVVLGMEGKKVEAYAP